MTEKNNLQIENREEREVETGKQEVKVGKEARKEFVNGKLGKDKKLVVAVSGYFDPLHVGHLECMQLAKKLGDKLVVIVNNDEQAISKKGYVFMPLEERVKIIKAIRWVDDVFVSIDKDRTVCKSLEKLKPDIFAKGGDRTADEIPEKEICDKLGIHIVDGLGKKIQSSSSLIKKAKKFLK